MVLIPPLMFIVVVIALWQAGVVRAAFWRLVAALGIALPVGGFLACGFVAMSLSLYAADLEAVVIVLAALLGLVSVYAFALLLR